MLCAVDEMLVKISSLVGANPQWHSGEPLSVSLKKVAAAESVRALWDKVWSYAQKAAFGGLLHVKQVVYHQDWCRPIVCIEGACTCVFMLSGLCRDILITTSIYLYLCISLACLLFAFCSNQVICCK